MLHLHEVHFIVLGAAPGGRTLSIEHYAVAQPECGELRQVVELLAVEQSADGCTSIAENLHLGYVAEAPALRRGF